MKDEKRIDMEELDSLTMEEIDARIDEKRAEILAYFGIEWKTEAANADRR